MGKDFNDFIDAMNTEEAQKTRIENATKAAGYDTGGEPFNASLAAYFMASQTAIDLLRAYHEWVNKTSA